MSTLGGGGTQEEKDKYKNAKDAKDLLDRIGEDIYKKIKDEAQKRSNGDLKGSLSLAKISGEEMGHTNDPCKLESKYTELIEANSKRNPCKKDGKGEDVSRFSKESGGECDDKKIEGNKGKESGACAPYRRLSLCNKNFQNINNDDSSKAKHNLLVDVCMAAKYEGESLKGYHEQYEVQYPSSGSTMCTMLARSFADIGDIIRGKDLYLGNKKKNENQREKEKLEIKLKSFFEQIYNSLEEKEKNHYNDTTDYYQLREDWWTANRATIWKAMTCSEKLSNASYFHATCSDSDGNSKSQANKYCRCNNDQPNDDKPNIDPPTYFDYVPQYLRWFEEWAEDFCRKRKHKLQDAIKKCRGENGTERYCDLNGFDCEKTKRGRNIYRWDYKCTGCFRSCSHFRTWIDNQKEQFDKQKKKYETEISVGGSGVRRQRRDARSTGSSSNYDGYESKFYEKLKETNYKDVEKFLEKLNEGICKKPPEASGETADAADFTKNKTKETFSHTTYCQACPWCGVKKQNGTWERKDNMDECPPKNHYKPIDDKVGTPINFLYSGDEETEIEKKLKEFCKTQNSSDGGSVAGGSASNSNELYQYWKCYEFKDLQKVPNPEGVDDDDDLEYDKEVENAGGLCILPNPKKNKGKSESNPQKEPHEIQKTFNPFFYYWVVHMLKDSIHWRTKKIKGCLKNGKTIKCTDKCKGDCGCFQKWVEKKKDEWKPIKEHFKTQKGIPEGWTHYNLLEWVLEKNLLLESLQEAYGNAKEKEHIKKLLDEEETAGVLVVASGGENNTTIDKILQHEGDDASKCKDCKPPEESLARSASEDERTPRPGPTVDPEEEEDDDDVEDDDKDDGAKEAEATGDTEDQGEVKDKDAVEEEKAKEAPAGPDACSIVAELFSNTTKFSDACKLKYGPGGKERYSQWKCISDSTTKPGSEATARSSGDTTGKSGATTGGSVCVPPRRRRLYVTPLTTWASDEATEARGSEASSQPDPLLKAFVESAAVETFFLWHRYKKIKEKERQEEQKRQAENGGLTTLTGDTLSVEQTPEKLLQNGKIPPDFLRLMFYTLGDYRDICIGDENVIKTLEASGDKNIKDISSKIEKILKNGAKKPGQTTTKPEDWWKTNGEHIWNGMICALTYTETSGSDGSQSLQQDTGLKTAFFGENGASNEPIPKYQYNTVKLDENSGEKKTNDTINTPKLSDFVLRPTYFRYLEEWGDNFCKERRRRLRKIRGECRGDKVCSGDGEDCKDNLFNNNYTTFPDFYCPECGKHCSSYRKWIETKKAEFEKQQKIYVKQKDNYVKESINHDKEFCTKLKTNYTGAAEFLEKLGSCKKDNSEDNGNDKLNFSQPNQTFKEAHSCAPCSQFKINCIGGNCDTTKGGGCDSKNSITANDIETMGKPTEINMLVSDNSTTEFKGGLENACKGKGIFEGIREDEWKCGNVCGYNVCKPKNGNGKQNDKNQIIIIRALFKRWLEYFLEDYNKIRTKLKPCMKNDEGLSCKNKCKDKCKCVEQWINTKKEEWKKIKEHYKTHNQDDDMTSLVKNFLGALQPQTDVKKATGHKELTLFESKVCNCTGRSEKKNGKESDIIDCMIKKLEDKIGECEKNHAQTSGIDCTQTTTDPPTLEDEDLLLEEEENTVKAPKICEGVIQTQTPEEETDGNCEEAPPSSGPKDSGTEEVEEEAIVPAGTAEPEPEPEQELEPEPKSPQDQTVPPAAPTKPQPQPTQPYLPPALKNAMLSSTIMWSVGIGFAAFTYFYLKKKTKSRVDLFSVLEIPKSDYDIPTKLSPNRYIPYTSGKYRGKRYIYLEGDSGTDSGYTDHYSDITSSSESEYEELDINDIYVPGSPKYKTLIEVVLEPSGNNTTASGKNTPSDTQNDIQNDGIPSSKITDNEWNTLKDEFISNMLQNQPNDVPNDYTTGNVTLNTQPNTLYFDKPEEKPFITSIHDRNLYSGEEYNYNVNMVNSMDDIPINRDNNPYSGIDLINDTLSGNHNVDIYDELLKRKENELFGTNHVKHTTINRFAKPARDDPLHNQLNLFHQWLDRHRDMCEKWKNNHERLPKLKELWENETHSGDINSGIPSGNHVLNTDVSIQIHMDNPKPKNEFKNMDTTPNKSTMDTMLDDLEKYNEPYYYDFYKNDIYYDVNDDDKTSMDNNNNLVDKNNPVDNNNSTYNHRNPADINKNFVHKNNQNQHPIEKPTKIQIEMNSNNREVVEQQYPIADIWNI
ncbi:erythrocyte membrane protein 1 [Plasmodium falciparum IGH-CR14]|uniref:Erythrocyte membrane protein 1 n=1 Tax=Plasmodium falciparum IGH-CR14 TaxID=580059 RepID=A0A0L1I2M6_PLAFA|nr:erythrocyte membrane protein 1 [Plasmodium falciparum IGH-CR14]